MAVFGDTLRQARAYKGVTLKEAEQATRINRHHLAALEDEHFAVLPPLIYQRGIVRNYATYLELDPGKLLALFDEARGGEPTVDLVAAVKPLEMPSHWAPNFAIIAFMVVMSAIVFAWVYSLTFSPDDVPGTVPAIIPTVTLPPDRFDQPSPTVRSVNAPPTVTPTPRAIATATPKPTSTPLPTPTVLAVVTEPEPEVGLTAPIETAQQAQPQPAATGAAATIRVVAQGDILVTIEADGAIVFSGWLGTGGATDWYTATSFAVTTSDGGLTLFENSVTGEQFYMGYEPNKTYYLGG